MPFLRNAWYMAGWADEVAEGTLLARRIAGEPIVFFRDRKGGLNALADMCPHRFAPLSRGKVEEGRIVCPYHGLRFGKGGRCEVNPHGAATASLSAKSFAAAERHACIWLWLGDREDADPCAIPAMSFIDRATPPERVRGHIQTDAHYMLMVENIMDLSHADYLHADSLGGGINTRTKGKVSEIEGGGVSIKWHASNDFLPPAHARLMQDGATRGDFQNEVYWYAPGVMKQRVLFGPHGELSTRGIDSWTMHNMTPETETRTHYFFCHTSDSVSRNPSIAPAIETLLLKAFQEEDGPTLEAQQERMGSRDFWDLKPALMTIDAGAAKVRRLMDARLREETAAR